MIYHPGVDRIWNVQTYSHLYFSKVFFDFGMLYLADSSTMIYLEIWHTECLAAGFALPR